MLRVRASRVTALGVGRRSGSRRDLLRRAARARVGARSTATIRLAQTRLAARTETYTIVDGHLAVAAIVVIDAVKAGEQALQLERTQIGKHQGLQLEALQRVHLLGHLGHLVVNLGCIVARLARRSLLLRNALTPQSTYTPRVRSEAPVGRFTAGSALNA